MKILIAVTHLLGIGHFARMRVLARGLAEAGHEVTLVSGGRPQPHFDSDGFRLVQLPPVFCTGTDFSTLYEADERVLTEATRAARRALLVELCTTLHPDVVITETFPFGRRALKNEFIALCETATALEPRPALICSIRDLLNPPSTPAKAQDAEDLIGRFYDAILVHGDARLVPPENGWPFGRNGTHALRMTGYIDESQTGARGIIPHGAIIVSGGGSAASLPLYRAACDAARLVPEQNWHMLIGHGVRDADFHAICDAAPAHMLVERARKDFRALLHGACLSVSQAGYNTVVDLLDAGLRMVLVPFAAGQEREQSLRAEALASRNLARIVTEAELSGETLARAVQDALALPAPDAQRIARDGVGASMAALEPITRQRRKIEQAWQNLRDTLATLQARGERIDVWWRDDDAIAPSPALEGLLALSRRFHAPVALAVIPAQATEALADILAASDCDVLMHGVAHRNHAPEGRKKQELGYRPATVIAGELRDAWARMAAVFGARALPVLVPPWNRIDPALLPLLAETGMIGLSTFKPRPARFAAPGVTQINTHCDPIAWKDGGGLDDEAALVTACAESLSAISAQPTTDREPLGLLTHHLVHDERIWAFLSRLLAVLSDSGAVRFRSARDIFGFHETVTPTVMLD